MRNGKLDALEFAQAADWEGGYYELYDYGFKPSQIEDPELAGMWEAFCDIMAQASKLRDGIESVVEAMIEDIDFVDD